MEDMEDIKTSLKTGQYYTISEAVEAERTIQRSRFIASLRKAENRQEVDEHLKCIAALYPKATHYCWGYRFAGSPKQEHASDAGEPSGSAGRPILGALKKFSLENVLGVVTRYYGGIKLGVKGLITAYGETTLLAIQKSKRIVSEPNILVTFTSSYDHYNIFLARLEKCSLSTKNIEAKFAENVSGEILIPHSILGKIERELKEIPPSKGSFHYEVKT